MRTGTYVCPDCSADVTHEFRVSFIIRMCENGCGFIPFFRKALSDAIAKVPTEERPEFWDELTFDQKVFLSVKLGFATPAEVE